jgi:hypothetical protein
VALGQGGIVARTKQVKLPANDGPPLVRKSILQGCPRREPAPRFVGFSVPLSANPAHAEVFPLALGRAASKGHFEAVNVAPTAGKASIEVYCGKGVGRVTAVRKTVTVRPHKGASATAKCPGDKNLLFGGYNAQTNPGFTKETIPVGAFGLTPQKWQVLAVNGGSKASELTALAYCAKVAPALQIVAHSNVAPGKANAALAKCPSGTEAAYGGYAGTVDDDADPLVIVSTLTRPRGRTIAARATNLGTSTTGKLQVLAYCR